MALSNINELRRFEKFLKGNSYIKPDYSYKSYILNQSLDSAVNKISLCTHLNILSDFTGEYYTYSLSNSSISHWFDSLADRYGFCAILEAQRINDATYHRYARLRSRVQSIISYPSLFITLTFTDYWLSRTSKKTRRLYITRFLKSVSNNYVANIDYGERRGREHYHALVQIDRIDSHLWRYGALNFEVVFFDSNKTTEKLAEYVSKLTNHAIKKTTRREHLIYPKNTFQGR